MSSFRKYGGIEHNATNNIVRNQISNIHNLSITEKIGLLNSKSVSAAHLDMSNNSILNVNTIYFTNGTSFNGSQITFTNITVNGTATITNLITTNSATFNTNPILINDISIGATGCALVTKEYVDSSSGKGGATGATGSSGSVGPSGSAGATGSSGSAGATGASGSAGSVGPSGASGSAGATGSSGPSGSTGPSGANGSTGATGPSGGSTDWTLSGTNLYPINTSYNVAIGQNTVTEGYALDIIGNALINGITVGISNNSNTNTAFGYDVFHYNFNDPDYDYNTAIGGVAGYSNAGNYNTYLGYNANSSGNVNNSTAIGYNAIIDISNQIVLGTLAETTYIPGNLDVSGNTIFQTNPNVINDDASNNQILNGLATVGYVNNAIINGGSGGVGTIINSTDIIAPQTIITPIVSFQIGSIVIPNGIWLLSGQIGIYSNVPNTIINNNYSFISTSTTPYESDDYSSTVNNNVEYVINTNFTIINQIQSVVKITNPTTYYLICYIEYNTAGYLYSGSFNPTSYQTIQSCYFSAVKIA